MAAIGYRLLPGARFPAAQEDVAEAIRYLGSLAETHNLDPDRIALVGRSAGGQIALIRTRCAPYAEGTGPNRWHPQPASRPQRAGRSRRRPGIQRFGMRQTQPEQRAISGSHSGRQGV